MKFNFRKIASVLTGAVMLSSTVALAAAANYPAPFVQNGGADVAIVQGSQPGAEFDAAAIIDIHSNLQYNLAKQTSGSSTSSTGATASGGDSANIGNKGSQKLYYGDSLNAGITSIGATELGKVLADGSVTDLKGTAYTYTQSIKLGSTQSVFGTSGGDISDPIIYLDAGTANTAPIYNYTLSFSKNLNVSDATNVQGQKVKILGVDYVIGASSSNTTLYLYGAGATTNVNGGETKTVTIGSKDHTLQLVTTSSTTAATIKFDETTKDVTEGNSYSFAGDLNVYVKNVIHPAFAGDLRSIELIVGANTLQLTNGATVKSGADATTVKGTLATVTAAGAGGIISGFTVSSAMKESKADHIAAGGSFSDPVFGGLKVQFAGFSSPLNDSKRATVKLDTDNNQYAYATFTSARAGEKGEQRLTYVYDSNTASTAVTPLLAHQTVTSNGRGYIHVLEGENASLSDWIVVNQGDAGVILEVTDMSIDSATAGTVTFQDVITGESNKISLTNGSTGYAKTGVNFFGGTGYSIAVDQSGSSVNVSWSSAGTNTLFPRIKLKEGGWIAFLKQTNVSNVTATTSWIFPDAQPTLTTSGSAIAMPLLFNNYSSLTQNGINWSLTRGESQNTDNTTYVYGINATAGVPLGTYCNFNATKGPAVLYLEPKKWNDASFGSFICVPLSTTGTTEISIGDPVVPLNGTNYSGYTTLNSDTYKKQAIDKFGVLITKEDRTNENGVATLQVPTQQMSLDVLFTADTAVVNAGSVGSGNTGTVKELGTGILVKDSEVAQVSGKNLIVVGGSCVNKVASELLDGAGCGASFQSKTDVGSGSFLIQTFSRTGGKVATLVAGFNAADTVNAAKYLVTQTVDTSVGKKYKGTTATTASLVEVQTTAPAAGNGTNTTAK